MKQAAAKPAQHAKVDEEEEVVAERSVMGLSVPPGSSCIPNPRTYNLYYHHAHRLFDLNLYKKHQ